MNNYLRLGRKELGVVEMTRLRSVLDDLGGADGGQWRSADLGLSSGVLSDGDLGSIEREA